MSATAGSWRPGSTPRISTRPTSSSHSHLTWRLPCNAARHGQAVLVGPMTARRACGRQHHGQTLGSQPVLLGCGAWSPGTVCLSVRAAVLFPEEAEVGVQLHQLKRFMTPSWPSSTLDEPAFIDPPRPTQAAWTSRLSVEVDSTG